MASRAVVHALAVTALAAASAASAYPARVVGDVNLRAGPSRDFPVVSVLASGLTVEVQGCESDYQWCDVDAGGLRGWARASYLEATYEGRPVVIADQGAALVIPVVAFVVATYWADYYRDRYWYERWRHWHHWHYRPRPPGWRPPPRPPRPPGVVLPPPRPPGVGLPPPRPPGGVLPPRPPRPPGVRPPPRPPGGGPSPGQRPQPRGGG